MLIAKFIDSIQKFIKTDDLCACVIRVVRAYNNVIDQNDNS